MALVKCTECGKEISSLAKACPSCGAPRVPTIVRPRSRLWGLRHPRWAVALLGIGVFIIYANYAANQNKIAEQKYLAAHPLTDKQIAANDHFTKCYQYRHASSSSLSENQRALILAMEGCHPDDRDDPRYDDASYPWNANAPHPWDQASATPQASTAPAPSAAQSDYAVVAALPCINLLQTYETERYGSLMSSVAEYIGKRDTDGGLGNIVNIEDYILTECRLNESSKIGEAVIKLFDDKGRGQLPPIPIGGGTENPQAQADWDTFNKWIHHQGPRPSVSASAAQSNGNWYYCEPTHAYYPNVTSCSVPWRQGN